MVCSTRGEGEGETMMGVLSFFLLLGVLSFLVFLVVETSFDGGGPRGVTGAGSRTPLVSKRPTEVSYLRGSFFFASHLARTKPALQGTIALGFSKSIKPS